MAFQYLPPLVPSRLTRADGESEADANQAGASYMVVEDSLGWSPASGDLSEGEEEQQEEEEEEGELSSSAQ